MGTEGMKRRLSEESRKALQSETWQKVRDGMKEKKEVRHFTTENTLENAYGWTWNQVVQEYLRTGYKEEGANPDITVMGVTYKTLKRQGMTVFYDADGDNLFDVTNERLEREYEWMMNNGAAAKAENEDPVEESENVAEEENAGVVEEEESAEAVEAQGTEQAEDEKEDAPPDGADDDVTPAEETPLEDAAAELPKPATAGAGGKKAKPAKQAAREKLEKERKAAKDSTFADPIIEYLLKRCEEDEGLAQDVIQEHKTWKKCFDYIFDQARKQSKGKCAAVRDDVVYEWAEDYYHKDDKAEEDKKAKKEAEDKAKREKAAAERKAGAKEEPAKAATAPPPAREKKPEKPKEQSKRNNRDMDGQLDMFSMMGM